MAEPNGDSERSQGERLRLLSRRSEYGYTDRGVEALPDEPEAVDTATQARLTAAGRRADQLRRQVAWRQASALILAALDTAQASARFDHSTISTMRVIERSVRRLDQEAARF